MKNKVTVDAKLLRKVLDYIYASEHAHYEEFCSDGGEKENHIYHAAVELENSIE